MTTAEHDRQRARVVASLLLGIRTDPRPPKCDHDARETARLGTRR